MANYFELDRQKLNFNQTDVTLAWRGSYDEICNNTYIQIQSCPLTSTSSNQDPILVNDSSMVTLPLHSSTGEELKFEISVQQCSNPMSDQEDEDIINVTFECELLYFNLFISSGNKLNIIIIIIIIY